MELYKNNNGHKVDRLKNFFSLLFYSQKHELSVRPKYIKKMCFIKLQKSVS